MKHEIVATPHFEIARRIDQLGRDLGRLPPQALRAEIGAIRMLARRNGLAAVAELAQALLDDLAAHGPEVAVGAYLERLRDAIDVTAEAQSRFVGLALAAIGAGWAFA